MRNLYILPRTRELDSEGHETDIEVTIPRVYAEFDALRKKNGISSFNSKLVTRKYAFELDNVPAESEYLKVVYPYSEPELPLECKGKSYSHIFGAKTRALEMFLLKRKFMGPSWIKITDARLESSKISWCKVECTINDPKLIKIITDEPGAPKSAPPLVIMSLALRTVMNHSKNSNEIVGCTGLIYDNGIFFIISVNIDGATAELNGTRFTAIRQLTDVPLPVGLNDALKKQRTKVDVLPSERALLSFLIAHIHRNDPDIIVGHNIIDFDLDVLLHRLKLNKIEHWSRIGRLRRNVWPKLQTGAGGTGDSSFAERQIASGRLLCDTYRAAQDLISSKSYSLTFLASTRLKIDRPPIEYEKMSSYFWNLSQLLEMIQHMEFDTYIVAQLMFNFQVLPLTKQLTNLAGNLWSRTMMGARSERNEYLLLHEFHQLKFICPDKAPYQNTPLVVEEEGEEGNIAPKKGKGKRKPAYAGGLVLDPKKGFYDKYILMLDFNSLYPSIIQEYNICFTTVQRTYDLEGDHMPPVPELGMDKGILPKLLGTLVDRRKIVKGLLKDPKITPAEYAQVFSI